MSSVIPIELLLAADAEQFMALVLEIIRHRFHIASNHRPKTVNQFKRIGAGSSASV